MNEIIEKLIKAEAEFEAAQKAEGRWSADYRRPLSRARAQAYLRVRSLRMAAGVDPCIPYGTKANPDLLNIK
jgi:hypothetical protein